MTKIVTAFRERDTAEKIASLLRESGYEVMRVCTSGNEVRRIFNTLQDGILISGYRLKDCTADQIAADLNEDVQMLCIARPDQLSMIETQRIFRLEQPVNKAVLNAWADMMVQLHYQKKPRKKEEERGVIEKAKEYLMKETGMSESEAHHYLQLSSMRSGRPMKEVAKRILEKEKA